MFFRYFKGAEGSDVKDQYIRVSDVDAGFYTDAKLDNGTAKYIEIAFTQWWNDALTDDTRALAAENADEGTFFAEVKDPENEGSVLSLACSVETGEPVDPSAAEAPATLDEAAGIVDAPATEPESADASSDEATA